MCCGIIVIKQKKINLKRHPNFKINFSQVLIVSLGIYFSQAYGGKKKNLLDYKVKGSLFIGSYFLEQNYNKKSLFPVNTLQIGKVSRNPI